MIIHDAKRMWWKESRFNFVYRGASDGVSSNCELRRTDGTTTEKVKEIDPDPLVGGVWHEFNDCELDDAVVVGDRIYFAGSDGQSGWELWGTDGTASGTVLVKDIDPGQGDSEPRDFVRLGSNFFFAAEAPSTGAELWWSDGTEGGTELVQDIREGSEGSGPPTAPTTGPDLISGESGVLPFHANDGSNDYELWQS